ncbi:hypothetical protein OsI_31841 [Oryza sativa Indica Group]|uniref:Ubiquitin thioesterase OTU n=1 Tax=Oryza sativa subsp. indica TaxID=39946 RepID=B8BCW0_ORYSI|nr:hypothetical protein OsI_31841 [Oryza sativa Indica Group]
MGCGALRGKQAVAGEAKTARVAELGESYIDYDFPPCRPATAVMEKRDDKGRSLYLVARCCLKQMAIYTPTVCLQRCTYSLYSQSCQLQGGLTQGMALWKYSRSQAVGYHVKIRLVGLPPKMNIKSLRTCFASSGKQLCGRRPARDNILKLKLDEPSRQKLYSILWDSRSIGHKVGATGTGLFLSFAVPAKANAEGPVDNNTDSPQTTELSTSYAHGKKVCTDYSVTGIPGDGRCLFRSVAHGACIRSGKRPDDDLQRKMADDLRAMVADEFIKRRAETEWFVEGDFDAYVSRIRKPHVWGGEPELLMASHVLRMPITVYMHDKEAGGLIAIAEYGQEYGKEDPIQVLFHGFGHYDALQIPGKGGPRSRL